MERDKNERLGVREIEEEKMKRKLRDMGIYEQGITYEEMKEILSFLNASEDTSNIISNNKNMQKGNSQNSDNECPLEITSETDVSQEVVSQECTEISRPMYSYILNHGSPTVAQQCKTARYSSSPDPASNFEVCNSIYRHRNSDSDETSEKQQEGTSCAHSTNRFISLRSSNSSRECQATVEIKSPQISGQSEHNQRLDRWRLNPLDVCINENDVPLRQPSRSPMRERMPFGCCKEAHTSEQRDRVVRALGQHLREMADLWYSWRRPTDLKFQWGSPIQVGTANGSLDRKPLTNPKTELIEAECTYGDNYERVNKRKASSLISRLNRESSSEDEDDQYNFARVKKKRFPSDHKSSNIDRTNQLVRTSKHEKSTSNINSRQQCSFGNDNSTDLDNEHSKSPIFEEKIDEEKNERLSPVLVTYSRKVVPSHSKACLSLSRQKKGNSMSKSTMFQKVQCTDRNKNTEQKSREKDNTGADKEICQELDDGEDDESDEENVTIAKKDLRTIQPLSILKEIRSRLQEEQSLFDNRKTIKETKPVSEKRENVTKQRYKKKKTEFGEQWKREEKLNEIKNKDADWENQLLLSDESSEMNSESNILNDNRRDNVSTSTSSISCPICNKLFPPDKIEDHAADCEQFETNNEEDFNDTTFECNICNNYKSDNGIEYEEHVLECINNRKDKMLSCGSEDINADFVPASSFRIYKPVSEQKESRTKISASRKRKH